MPPREEPIDLAVERVGAGGDGIADWRGTPVFLPFTVPGDVVRARLGPSRGGSKEARVVEFRALGSGRAEPVCRHFGRCGGCALQHLDPELYRAVKLDALQGALRRARIESHEGLRFVSLPPARRRARLGLVRPRGPHRPARIGFRERFGHDLVDMRECPVLERVLFALVGPLRDLAPHLLPPGGAAEIGMTRTDSGVDLLVEAAAPPALSALEALAGFAEAADLARIVWRTGRDEKLVVERRPVRVVLSGVAVPLPPGAFLQASAAAEAALVAEVRAGIGDHRSVLDLYAGLGTFAFALAGGGPVHAVEGDPRAAAALAAAAARVPGVSVARRDLARDPLRPPELADFAAAVFDPPRAGAWRQAEALAAAPFDTVVAVSCNPATFARDARLLAGGGFRLERLVAIDQFVWTPHLEIVALFSRRASLSAAAYRRRGRAIAASRAAGRAS